MSFIFKAYEKYYDSFPKETEKAFLQATITSFLVGRAVMHTYPLVLLAVGLCGTVALVKAAVTPIFKKYCADKDLRLNLGWETLRSGISWGLGTQCFGIAIKFYPGIQETLMIAAAGILIGTVCAVAFPAIRSTKTAYLFFVREETGALR